MPPISPVTPSFPIHQLKLGFLRRKSVYGWPPPSGEWIQEKLQNVIAEMQADGYEPDVINRILRTLAELTLNESERFLCNVSRAVFFAELVNLEINTCP
jgi:hypothetical protein